MLYCWCMAEESNFMETGRVVIQHGLGADGAAGVRFEVEGMSPIQAIGAVQIVHDLMRAREFQGWTNIQWSDDDTEGE